MPAGGRGSGLDLRLVAVADVYHKAGLLDGLASRRRECEALGLSARRGDVDHPDLAATDVTGELGQRVHRRHDFWLSCLGRDARLGMPGRGLYRRQRRCACR